MRPLFSRLNENALLLCPSLPTTVTHTSGYFFFFESESSPLGAGGADGSGRQVCLDNRRHSPGKKAEMDVEFGPCPDKCYSELAKGSICHKKFQPAHVSCNPKIIFLYRVERGERRVFSWAGFVLMTSAANMDDVHVVLGSIIYHNKTKLCLYVIFFFFIYWTLYLSYLVLRYLHCCLLHCYCLGFICCCCDTVSFPHCGVNKVYSIQFRTWKTLTFETLAQTFKLFA